MRPLSHTSPLLRSALLCALLMAFFGMLYSRYQQDAEELRHMRLRYAASQMGKRIEQQLTSRVGVLEFYAQLLPQLHVTTYADFSKWTRNIRHGIPGFFAINFINPEGVIEWVEPYEPNKAAQGRRPGGRPEIQFYLDRAKASRTTTMTHFVTLFQGPVGFAVYVPVFEQDQFRGYLNGVFSNDEFFSRMVGVAPNDVIAVTVAIAGRPEPVYSTGADHPVRDDGVVYDLEIYGQRFQIDVRSVANPANDLALDLIALGVIISVLLVSVVSYMLMRSQMRLRDRLERERFHGVLLNLLVHDIQNPLLVVRLSVDAAMKVADELVAKQLAKTYYGLNQLQDVIQRVRDLRATELGKHKPQLAAVPVNDLISDSLHAFEARLKEKDVTPDFQMSAENPAILVDRVIFQNNVINNVLSNALKFSEPGAKVTMQVRLTRDLIALDITDHGVGMPAELAARLMQEGDYDSQPGTRGEAGTGIGMLQVVAYTRFFGGRVEVTSRSRAQFPTDSGTTVSLYLPRV